LEDAYKTYVGRVLKETTQEEDNTTSEKEGKVLAEGKDVKQKVTGTVKKGNNEDQIINESVMDQKDNDGQRSTLAESEKQHLRRVAGLA
jgi:hypothetical protein